VDLFLRQSWLDAWENYIQLLSGSHTKLWDYVVLTAANEVQAQVYREQIESRVADDVLPKNVNYVVIPDPDDKRVGSGGATLNVLSVLKNKYGCDSFTNKHILCIHSGGDSKRVPQYSASGKLFSPVPRKLPDGRRSTLFDEAMIWMASVPPRITDGLLVCSGDALLMFNPLQIDFYGTDAAAISFKQSPEIGEHHGVYVCDQDGYVNNFLHKQKVSTLHEKGAVDKRGKIDIDTGAVVLSSRILEDLYALIDNESKHFKYVNEVVRLSFYADFLFPLANETTLEQYLLETPEGEFSDELAECRRQLWDVLNEYKLKLIRLAPASFVHFGTTQELLKLVFADISNYKWLDWSRHVLTNVSDDKYAANNSYITPNAEIGTGTYIEDSIIQDGVVVGDNCVISCCDLQNVSVPNGTVLHALKLNDGCFCVRKYSVDDNPKDASWFGKKIDEPLWSAALHPVRETIGEAVAAALGDAIIEPCMSLQESFEKADTSAIKMWQTKMHNKVQSEKILSLIEQRVPAVDALEEFFQNRIPKRMVDYMIDVAAESEFSEKIRIYYYLSFLVDESEKEEMLNRCFGAICDTILDAVISDISFDESLKIAKEYVIAELPLRVNFGGGWSDTPPYCLEHGGNVLNAAITVNNKLPVRATLSQIDEKKIILSSLDDGSEKSFTNLSELQECNNPYDVFALHKAALITCGVIPYAGKENPGATLSEILDRLGGGFKLCTEVRGIPRGSGLGTSSILAGACVKAVFEFFGQKIADEDLYNRVLCMEQLMSTGGGWQDQVGGLVPGIKIVRSKPALKQHVICEHLELSDETYRELDERFCLIYTGQRRLARNLLREIVGNYLESKPDTLFVLEKIQQVAERMKKTLEAGDVDAFAGMLNEHWELSKRLDFGSTNTCIEQLLLSVEDMLDGKMMCGAGGGGFLQVILKKGITREMLSERLGEIFGDCGVDAWECGILR